MHRFSRSFRSFRLLALATVLALAAPLAAWSLAAGPKTAVYAIESEQGTSPQVAARSDGSFLVLWRQQDGKLAARAFSASGTPAGVTRTLFTSGAGTSVSAWDVAALASGGYVAVWEESTPLFSSVSHTTRIQLLDASGQLLGAPLAVAQNAHAPARITALPGGGFVLVWGQALHFTARHFDAEGDPQSPMHEIASSDVVGAQLAVAVRPDGGFVVATVRPPNLGRQDVVYELLDADGLPDGLGETPAHAPDTTGRSNVSVWSGPFGHFVITWTETEAFPTTARRLHARLFGPDGQPDSPEILITGEWPEDFRNHVEEVVVRTDGSFLVLWNRHPSLFARLYDPAGAPIGDDLVIEAAPGSDPVAASAAASSAGWVASWSLEGLSPTGPFFRLLGGACNTAGGASLCLNGNRFRAEVSWRVPATGAEGIGTATPRTEDTGTFWFFNPTNVELIVKVLDGRGINGHFWVFYGSLTDVEFDLTVTDTVTGKQRTYHNPAGTMASQADTTAF